MTDSAILLIFEIFEKFHFICSESQNSVLCKSVLPVKSRWQYFMIINVFYAILWLYHKELWSSGHFFTANTNESYTSILNINKCSYILNWAASDRNNPYAIYNSMKEVPYTIHKINSTRLIFFIFCLDIYFDERRKTWKFQEIWTTHFSRIISKDILLSLHKKILITEMHKF